MLVAANPVTPVTPNVEEIPARQQPQNPIGPALESKLGAADVKQETRGVSHSLGVENNSEKAAAPPGMDIPQQSIEVRISIFCLRILRNCS